MTNIATPGAASEKKGKNIFVTVGTTRFDKLVSAATSKVALEWMERQGFSSLTVQYGRGEKRRLPSSPALEIQTYDFRPSLTEDMERADLIISHAGAGTVMEALRMKKKLVVVINTDLMDNHQTELAGAMAARGHLFMVTEPRQLDEKQTWASFEDDNFVPVPHREGDPFEMSKLLDSFLGFPVPSKLD
uniref:UDP-N-acetylglucosamine transferase subunit ALG13 n=1 Tax=Pseudo-nitzschia australis TaxID=44445 RepID=A0A7S4AM01_9STRA|mmetsp:Transcript_25025/g.54871  ORF Transcript_25025/g.54871 Transcript_25025/m.54871 type:complete len:189 (+) Transcript_25025:137-703(+)|eukprot:CAMPEP_0168175486 /NCGR_PEP_ID=MMETSP0139_2-20121125/7156_1 /TAXON_ID=44445 /ORGANISM="Pseudo-nitzschia australis, Strain 10249 10 AB" /LENGTH=188 /DNA_ID=CAMNT_0008093893 /DNA_START=85 /DNA_END=651 /DNA_ORIENTATION=-